MCSDRQNARFLEGTYAWDNETEKLVKYAMALCKFRNQVGGFKDLPKYLAVVAFERMIRLTGEKNSIALRIQEDAVNKTIYGLHDQSPYRPHRRAWKYKIMINEDECEDLQKWWGFRISIAHAFATKSKDEFEETLDLLRFICERIQLDFETQWNKRTPEDLSFYGKGRPAPSSIKPYEKIVLSDFDEFDQLFDKCYGFQSEITKSLRNKLFEEEISGFSLNTGSIWVPWVAGRYSEDSGKRTRTYEASLGIVLSPCNVRVGIEFGARAYARKEKYYELLGENKLDKALRSLVESKIGFKFYDTYWYYYLRPNPIEMEWFLEPKEHSAMKSLVQRRIDEVQNYRENGEEMSANSMLLSKVFDRYQNPVEFSQALEDLVKPVSRIIDRLYPILAAVES